MSILMTLRTTVLLTCASVMLLGCTEVRGDNADIGTDHEPTVEPLYSIVSNPLVRNYATTEDLVLESDLIVLATVRDVLDPFIVYPGEPPLEGNPDFSDPVIYTETILEVREVIKGDNEQTVTVRQTGGRVDGLSFEMLSEPEFVIGDDLLLFLRDYSDWGYGDDIYWVVGLYQGFWSIDTNDLVSPRDEDYDPRTLEAFREELADSVARE